MELVKDLKSQGVSAILYAHPGLGKTTALSMLPGKTLIIDVDRGTSVLSNTDNIDVVRIKDDLSNLKEIVAELMTDCKWDNVCLDTLSELEKSMLTNYGRTGKNDGAPELGHYNKAKFKMSDYVRQLRNLTDKGVNVIFTAWEKAVQITEPTGEQYTQLMPDVRGTSEFCGMCDVVARLEIHKQEDGTERRGFRLESSQSVYAKDRLGKRKGCAVDKLIMEKK